MNKTAPRLWFIMFLLACCFLTGQANPANAENQADDGAIPLQTGIDVAEPNTDQTKQDQKKRRKKTERKKLFEEENENNEEPVHEVNPELVDDFAKLAKVCNLNKTQQTELLQTQKSQTEALAKWDEKWNPRIEKAQERIDKTEHKRKRERLEKQLNLLKSQRERLADQEFIKVFRILKPAQVSAWNTEKLWQAMENEFHNLQLTEEQNDKIKLLCRKTADKVPGKKEIPVKSQLPGLIRQSQQILSKQQWHEYRQAKQQEKRQERETRTQKNEMNDEEKKSTIKRGRSRSRR